MAENITPSEQSPLATDYEPSGFLEAVIESNQDVLDDFDTRVTELALSQDTPITRRLNNVSGYFTKFAVSWARYYAAQPEQALPETNPETIDRSKKEAIGKLLQVEKISTDIFPLMVSMENARHRVLPLIRTWQAYDPVDAADSLAQLLFTENRTYPSTTAARGLARLIVYDEVEETAGYAIYDQILKDYPQDPLRPRPQAYLDSLPPFDAEQSSNTKQDARFFQYLGKLGVSSERVAEQWEDPDTPTVFIDGYAAFVKHWWEARRAAMNESMQLAAKALKATDCRYIEIERIQNILKSATLGTLEMPDFSTIEDLSALIEDVTGSGSRHNGQHQRALDRTRRRRIADTVRKTTITNPPPATPETNTPPELVPIVRLRFTSDMRTISELPEPDSETGVNSTVEAMIANFAKKRPPGTDRALRTALDYVREQPNSQSLTRRGIKSLANQTIRVDDLELPVMSARPERIPTVKGVNVQGIRIEYVRLPDGNIGILRFLRKDEQDYRR